MDTLAFLKSNPLFTHFSQQELAYISHIAVECVFEENEYILHENQMTQFIYLIQRGEVAILKEEDNHGAAHLLETLRAGDVIGEMSLIDRKPHSASVKAVQSTTIIALPIDKIVAYSATSRMSRWLSMLPIVMKEPSGSTYLYDKIIKNCASMLVTRLRSTNNLALTALQHDLAHEKARNAASQFMINVIILLSFYALAVQFMTVLQAYVISTTYINIPFMIVLVIPILLMMKHSGYPMSTYGFTLRGAGRSIVEAGVLTLPFFAIVLLYKWLLIHFSSGFAHRSLFDMTLSLTPGAEGDSLALGYKILLVFFYLLFVPVQEILTRGAIQSSFQLLLTGKYRTLWAILLSNLIFSTMHSHVSLGFGLIVYIPGLFWGWLYARQQTLCGVVFSHLLLGIWAIFVVGLL